MNKVLGLVILAGVLAAGIWLSAPPGPQGIGVTEVAAADQADNGADLYSQFCEQCHGPDKAGLEMFEGELADLELMLSGSNQYMPDFTGLFTDEEVTDIFAYLMTSDDEAVN